MTNLRDLFNTPSTKPIGGIPFQVYKVGYDQFGDALEVGVWLQSMDWGGFDIEKLRALKEDSPERLALDRTIAGCLALNHPSSGTVLERLQPADVSAMPVVMLAEALAVVMEVNADFFFQTLPRLLQTSARMQSIGSELLSSLLARGTTPTLSDATPSDKSAAS